MLYLGNQNACADGVHRACGNKEYVARPHGIVRHSLVRRAVLNVRGKFLGGHFAFKAADQLRTRLCVQNVPHLGLAGALVVLLRIGVVGMHLQRKAVARVDQLDQNIRRSLPPSGKCLLQRFACKAAVLHGAVPVFVRGEHPSLGSHVVIALHAKALWQAIAAPQIVLDGRL